MRPLNSELKAHAKLTYAIVQTRRQASEQMTRYVIAFFAGILSALLSGMAGVVIYTLLG